MREALIVINRKIEIRYLVNKDNQKIGFTLDEIASDGQNGWEVDYIEKTEFFNKFTNKGKVSKSELSKYAIVNAKAEEMLQKQLEVEESREADTKRAIELKSIVDEAYFKADDNTVWTTIKEKTSHSDWYQHGGQLNMPSVYIYQVPKCVKDEAVELQMIRSKHTNDAEFDFDKTSYNHRKVRIADHDNGR